MNETPADDAIVRKKSTPMPSSDAFVFFGATGDLTYKQIFPALQAMIRRGHFDMPIIGVARSTKDLDGLRARAHESIEKHGGVDSRAFAALSKKLQYVNGDYGSQETFRQLRKALGGASHPLYYLAIPPDLFVTVAQGLAKADCDKGARVVVEKPFGRDLASAQVLTEHSTNLSPNRRFSGSIITSARNRSRICSTSASPILSSNQSGDNYIQSVQVTMAETLGVEGRGGFDEEVGAIRDVVQNQHVGGSRAAHDGGTHCRRSRCIARREAAGLSAMRPLAPSDVTRGQFRGYRNERGVAADSRVETFAAVKLYIDTWRWAGVPFYIRAGKRMPVSATEVLVELKRPPQSVFDKITRSQADYFRFRLSPNVLISLGARAKMPGEAMVGEAVELVVRQVSADEMTPYERLLGDAIEVTLPCSSVKTAWKLRGELSIRSWETPRQFTSTSQTPGGPPKLTRS